MASSCAAKLCSAGIEPKITAHDVVNELKVLEN